MTPVADNPVIAPDRNLEEEKKPGAAEPPRIRCPLCDWSPRKEDKWFCTCGNEWNTFDTGGVCPACQHQWTDTQCLSWNRAQWPMPDFVRRDPLRKMKARIVCYSDDDPNRIEDEHPVDDGLGLEADAVYGYGAIEIRLTTLTPQDTKTLDLSIPRNLCPGFPP